MNKLVKTVSKGDVYYEYLKALNGILLLSDYQLRILALLVDIDLNYVFNADEPKNVVSTKCRRRIRRLSGIAPENLCRLIKKFKANGILIKGVNEGEWYLNRILVPEIVKDRVQISIILKINETEE